MKLRTIALSLYGYPKEVAVPFSFETRNLCNYVQRYARLLKIEADGFNQIVIHADPSGNGETDPGLVPEKSLRVPFSMDISRYRQATPGDKQNYFIEILVIGLRRANEFRTLPLPELLCRIEEFRVNGFHNRWIHQTKSIRSHGIVAELQCELTIEEFRLTLEVRRTAGSPLRVDILSTKPDETCFHFQFKDITVREDHLVVTNRMYPSDELVRFPLSRFTALAA
jgi:hypothetical protein